MAAQQPKFGFPGLKITFSAAAALTGGRLVEAVAGTRRVQHAGAGSVKVVGVVLNDVPVTRASVSGLQVGDGSEAVVARFVVTRLNASGAVAEGDKLIAAATGRAAAAGATPDARTVVGQALEAAADGADFLAVVF